MTIGVALLLAGCGPAGTALSPQLTQSVQSVQSGGARATESIVSLTNGVEWPSGFRPFAPSSPWNRPLTSANPLLLRNSNAIVALAESRNTGAYVHTAEYEAGYDYSHPVAVASSSDPLVTPRCTTYCHPVFLTKPFRIPARARAASGGDHHLAVVQPDGTEIDLWGVSQPYPGSDWKNGDTLSYGSGNSCGSFFGGSGFVQEGATLSGACLSAGLIRQSELAAGVIPHALFVTTACLDKAYVYPATQPSDYLCTGAGPHVPIGARVWLDLSDAAIDALALKPWEKTVLHALHQYGAFVGDSAGKRIDHTDTLVQFTFEDDAQFVSYGAPSAPAALARSLGWNPVSVAPRTSGYGRATRWTASDNWQPVNWAAHLHLVDPCYAKGTC